MAEQQEMKNMADVVQVIPSPSVVVTLSQGQAEEHGHEPAQSQVQSSPPHLDTLASDGGTVIKEKNEKPENTRKEFNFWTDQEVWLLLDIYEEKWNQLDRGNVKSKHWEEVASRLASQGNGLWVSKTPTQCKNKIEDMKKKYRAEKAMKIGAYAGPSKWIFFSRMESMLRNGSKAPALPPPVAIGIVETNGHANGHANSHVAPAVELESYGNCNHLEHVHFFRQAPTTRIADKEMNEGPIHEDENTSFTTPQNNARKENGTSLNNVMSTSKSKNPLLGTDSKPILKRRKSSASSSVSDVVAVIKSFGESLMKVEDAKLQMQREVVRLQAEAEFRRIEMELKRTEMLLNTQLQIAKLFSTKTRKKKVKKSANADQVTQESN